MRNKEIKIVVELMLREHYLTRDDDNILFMFCCYYYKFINDINELKYIRIESVKRLKIDYVDLKSLPSFKTIERLRRKFQEKNETLRGQLYARRKHKCEPEFKEYIKKI